MGDPLSFIINNAKDGERYIVGVVKYSVRPGDGTDMGTLLEVAAAAHESIYGEKMPMGMHNNLIFSYKLGAKLPPAWGGILASDSGAIKKSIEQLTTYIEDDVSPNDKELVKDFRSQLEKLLENLN